MKNSLKIRVALHMAQRIEACARVLRRQLRDHNHNESLRIHLADKRARGLRLYVAWATRRPSDRSSEFNSLPCSPV
jgi:hypothetical protein